MTLSDKMKRLAEIAREIDEATAHLLDERNELEAEVKSEVLELGQSIAVGNVTAKYGKGRGRYDWDLCVKDAKPPASDVKNRLKYNNVIEKHTAIITKVDCLKIAKELELDGSDYYKAGNPSVNIVIE